MALRGAVASGNWSNPAIWNGGVLPSSGDIVASNGFTVTIDQNINVDSITNAAATDPGLVPTMTSDTTPSGVVSASSVLNTSLYPAWKAFDKNNSTIWASSTSGPPQWLEYQFPSPTVIDRYILLATNTDAPVTWEFQAWNGSSWIVLQSIVNAPKVGTATTYNFTNTTAYTRYRMYMLAPFSQGYMAINELTLANSLALASATAGGGFTLNGGVTVTLTNTTAGIIAGPTNCVTYSAASGTSTISGIVRGSTTNSGFAGVLHSGAANLNINGDIQHGTLYAAGNNPGVRKTGTGTLSIVGNLYSIVDSNGNSPLYNTGTGIINITGNLYGHTLAGYTAAFTNSEICTINITGNIYAGTTVSVGTSPGFSNSVAATINVTGNVYSDKNNSGISTTAASRLTVIGILSCNYLNANLTVYPAVSSTSATAINLFTGPFISSPYGTFPYQCVRMHLIPSVSTYLEFRDETTNGAVSPGAIAPAARLVSPGGAVDAPIPANVRSGISYASGTLLGTMAVPSPSNVANNVPVDNTVGTAVLDPNAIWSVPLASINTLNSIGRRVKNAATVETTGAQIESILNSL